MRLVVKRGELIFKKSTAFSVSKVASISTENLKVKEFENFYII